MGDIKLYLSTEGIRAKNYISAADINYWYFSTDDGKTALSAADIETALGTGKWVNSINSKGIIESDMDAMSILYELEQKNKKDN
ncbi:hypothetical protein FKV73_02460 [Weissella paramesenteroides]|nr:hypothetical protein FKV79_05010 [Weissella paramesenteroides]KAA8438550.1 hypothetical protein FKV73_02460 [Weissella paramesenteroides]